MPNPRGINQYSKGGGKKASGGGRAKSAASIAAAQRSRTAGRVQLASGTSAGAHAAFVASRLAAKKSKSRKKR